MFLEGASTFYFSEEKTQSAVVASDLEHASGDVSSNDTVKKAMQRLGQKKENYLNQTGTPIFDEKSVTMKAKVTNR